MSAQAEQIKHMIGSLVELVGKSNKGGGSVKVRPNHGIRYQTVKASKKRKADPVPSLDVHEIDASKIIPLDDADYDDF